MDLGHIHSIITTGNENSIDQIKRTQNKKLEFLLVKSNCYDPGKTIFNYSSILTDAQKSLLCKGLSFAIPPKKLGHGDYLPPFEILFKNLKASGDISNENLNFSKVKLKDIALTPMRYYNINNHSLENLTKEEAGALIELAALANINIQKADKGNLVVLIDKETYVNNMLHILEDDTKFSKLSITDEELLDTLLEMETNILNVLAILEAGSISLEKCMVYAKCIRSLRMFIAHPLGPFYLLSTII